ncbi:6213_t:CDS:2, partial [Entrophospora sp. SA101]
NQSTTIELNIALKNLYPTEHVFNRREIETWRAMLNATGRTKMSPFERNHSKVDNDSSNVELAALLQEAIDNEIIGKIINPTRE